MLKQELKVGEGGVGPQSHPPGFLYKGEEGCESEGFPYRPLTEKGGGDCRSRIDLLM